MAGTDAMGSGGWVRQVGLAAMAVWLGLLAVPAEAQYFRRPVSDIDPKIMLIDEQAVLGAKLDPETVLVDHAGKELRWGDMLGKPLILVLAYYTCDGSCSLINSSLAGLLADVSSVTPGEDFRILTLSFDRNDTAASTTSFREQLGLAPEVAPYWSFATFKRQADLEAQTARIGFKFFWSPEDRLFLHPGAFLFFSPDGRLIRVLYHQDVGPRDIELAVLDAKQGKFRPQEVVNLLMSLCYSYSYRDGRYVMSIPVIVGLGALGFGLTTLLGSVLFYKFSRRTTGRGDGTHAQMV